MEYIAAGAENIAEASFYIDGLYCAVDILHKNGDGWDIVEVKSSTHVSDTYVFHDHLDIKGLFKVEDYTGIRKSKHDEVEKNITSIRQYVDTTIGK